MATQECMGDTGDTEDMEGIQQDMEVSATDHMVTEADSAMEVELAMEVDLGMEATEGMEAMDSDPDTEDSLNQDTLPGGDI